VPRAPRHFVAHPEEAALDVSDRPLAGLDRGRDVKIDAPREIETALGWRVDRRREDDDGHQVCACPNASRTSSPSVVVPFTST